MAESSNGMNKAVRKLFILVSVYMICWLPIPILLVCRLINFIVYNSFCDEIAHYFLYGNSSINPFINTAMNIRFQKAFTETLHSFIHC